ncbi:protein NLRC5-like [Porites lutea]|uniref:protein NLRC5-like n=1 Tax=Porites lutea TaxID=51062 RepID=UPI003CC51087
MKKRVLDVTEKPYRDLKSPFHNPGEGPRRDLKLDEIFTNLIVYEGRAKYDFSGDRVKQLNEYLKANESLRPTRPGDIFDAKGQKQKILVVGRPGIGKTMFSTKILRNWASDNLFNERQKWHVDLKVSFLIKLRMFNSRNQELNLREFLDHSEYSTALSEELWNYIRDNPKRVLVIFDGFDEYSGRTKINKDDSGYINSQEERMPVYFLMKKIVEGKILTGAKILTTTRPNAVSCMKSLHFDKTVEILGFSTEQVNNYVQKFTKEADKAETIKQHITSNLNLVAFCYVPVNCFIICSCLLELLGNTGFTSLPTRMTEIYSIAVRMFYFSYDDDQYRHNKTEGQQYFLKPFKELPSSVRNVFTRLGKIAFDGIKSGRLIFESHEVKRLKSNGLFHRLPDFRDRPLAEGRAQYCFLHLTLQEFLAAKYLVDTNSSEKLRDFVAAHIQDGAWKVVMQFVAGLLAEKEGKSSDIFSNLLPSETSTRKVEIKMNEDSEERYETLTRWPADKEDRLLVVTLFNCMYENNASDREVQKKLAKIGCNALHFSQCNLSPLDCLALVHALKSVEGILYFDLSWYNLQSLGCIEIAKLLPGNQHNQGFCELKRLNLWNNNITDEGVKHLATALTHANCKLNSLNLMANNITDEGVKQLATALTHTNCTLNSLNLAGNNITDEGVKHLATALTHTNCTLNSLNLAGNNITDKGKNLLNSMNINCYVSI